VSVRVGLIGAGQMGRVVARMVNEVSDEIEITSVYDPDPDAVAECRKLFGDAFKTTSRFEDVLTDDAVDWVMVASMNKQHAEQTIAAFAAGKNVFCQKPLALSVEECLAMREAWQRSGKQFVIGFNLRYSPHYRTIKKLLEEGAIGDLVSFEFNETLNFNHGGFILGDWRRFRANAGSHLLEKACHDVDLANWFVGSRASRVASFGGLNFFTPEHEAELVRVGKTRSGRQGYMTWRNGQTENPFTSEKDIVDNQVAIIEYENGVRATLHLNSNAGIPERRMYLCGTRGTLRADLLQGKVEVGKIGFGESVEVLESLGGDIHGGGDEVLAYELGETFLKGVPTSTTLEDGLQAAVTCFAIDEAMDHGTVVDCRPYWQQVDP
jgi:predicted dehydrogenase